MSWRECVLLLSLCVAATTSERPFVVLPSVWSWDADNEVLITPYRGTSNVDIRVIVKGGDVRSDVAIERQLSRPTAKPARFLLRPKAHSQYYNVTISVTGYNDFETQILGGDSLREVIIQAEKPFYKSGEIVKIRSLPITKDGEIYGRPVYFILENPNGFRIMRRTRRASGRFVAFEFQLPLFCKFGKWRVLAMTENTNRVFGVATFMINDYTLPKFLLRLDVDYSESSADMASVTVSARLPHGAAMNGTVALFCTAVADRLNSSTSPSQLVARGEVANGRWTEHVSLKACARLIRPPQGLFRLVAKVTDINLEEETTSLEWDTRKPDLEIVPARPLLTAHSDKIRLLSPLTAHAKLHVRVECISDGRFNGRISVVRPTKVDERYFFAQLSNKHLCTVNLIRAYRTTSFNQSTSEELLAIPYLSHPRQFESSWIDNAHPEKYIYRGGEEFEAVVPNMNDLNYMVVCDSKVILNNAVADSMVKFVISPEMNGICTLYVFSASAENNRFDMWTFMVQGHSCPAGFETTVSAAEMGVNEEIEVRIKALPNVLTLLRITDTRLDSLGQTSKAPRREKLFSFKEFDKPDLLSTTGSYMSGFIDIPKLFAEIRKECEIAGQQMVNCEETFRSGFSAISDSCLINMKARCGERPAGLHSPLSEQSTTTPYFIQLAGMPGLSGFKKASTSLRTQPETSVVQEITAPLLNDATPNEEPAPPEELVRNFFPEVWLFEDYVMDDSGELVQKLRTPHSVTSWIFQSIFWIPKQPGVCEVSAPVVRIKRHIFMLVEMPTHVYENETVQTKITVSSDLDEPKQLSICFNFLSPVVCGDVGSNGGLGEAEYSQVALKPGHPVVKTIFVKFLRTGDHNLTFKLVDNPLFPVGRWHCRDDDLHVYDRIQLTVKVSQRVDLDEHFRKIVLEKSVPFGGSPLALSDVIQFENNALANGTLKTAIKVSSNEKVFDAEMELSEWEYMQMQELGSKTKRLHRRKRETASFEGLGELIKELSLATYQLRPKPAELVSNAHEDLNDNNDDLIGNLRSELLTYSDCNSGTAHRACGFGEYGIPASPAQRDPMLSLLATSLLCQQKAMEQYVCGPMQYFAEMAREPLNTEHSYVDTLGFASEKDKDDFLLALISWVGRDCAHYACVRNSSAWVDIHSLRFDESQTHERDVRVDAALARVVTRSTSTVKRNQLINRARLDEAPFWQVDISSDSDELRFMRRNIQRRANILANALAMLAFIASDKDYEFWKSRMNLEKESKWLVEQQDGNMQFETAALPTSAKEVHLTSIGDTSMVLGVRLLTEKRRRSKRDPNDVYPVSIRIKQQRAPNSALFLQTVEITPHSAMLQTLQVEHGLFTGFSSSKNWFQLLDDHSKVISAPQLSNTAVHVVLSGLRKDVATRYVLTVAEPPNGYTPENLAPIAITAKKDGIVGLLVIGADDLNFYGTGNELRRKRSVPMRLPVVHNLIQSSSESNVVETVCLEDGACTCAEVTCETECTNCSTTNVEQLCSEYAQRGFAVVFRIMGSTIEHRLGTSYDVYRVKILEWYGTQEEPATFSIWVRECNTQCHLMTRHDRDKARYLLIGRPEGIFHASSRSHEAENESTALLHKHYVVRDGDRLARSIDCWGTFSQFQDSDCLRHS